MAPQRLFRVLDEMHKRLSQVPGYIELTPAERAGNGGPGPLVQRARLRRLTTFDHLCASNRQQKLPTPHTDVFGSCAAVGKAG
jgi:hypothetical protein